MTNREAESLIYLEMAESLDSDVIDSGSWINYNRSEEDKKTLLRAAKSIIEDYRALHKAKAR